MWADFKFPPINLYVMPKPYEMWYNSIEDWWY